MKFSPRNNTLTSQVETHLREQIISGEIPLGSRISEIQLAQTLGVSKTPVREALLHLQEEGLVTIQPQKGTFVFTPDEDLLRKVCEQRVILEPPALLNAMKANPVEFSKALRKTCEKMEKNYLEGDYKKYLFGDMEYHELFFEFCDNPFLSKSYRLIASLLSVLRIQLELDKKHLHKSFVEHKELLEKIEQNNPQEAIKILEKHIGINPDSYWMNISQIVKRMESN